jgi:hypothetical protein
VCPREDEIRFEGVGKIEKCVVVAVVVIRGVILTASESSTNEEFTKSFQIISPAE